MEWDFDARDARAARRARSELAEYLHRECGDVDPTFAQLVLGELLGNVARYAPGPAHIEATVCDSHVTIEVRDSGPGFEHRALTPSQRDLFSEHGRGLMIVETLSDEFDVKCHNDNGCRVRARMSVRAK